MKVAELLARRQSQWQSLERACAEVEASRGGRRLSAEKLLRFAALYRAACADLALADAYQLPPTTVRYLHQLVARSHNQLYRSRTMNVAAWLRDLLLVTPQRLFRDNSLRLALLVFWGGFLGSMYAASVSPRFAEQVAGEDGLRTMEEMYSDNLSGSTLERTGMAGFYVKNNAGIGLQCFAAGLVLGVGGLFTLIFNATYLGAIFGHMSTVPQSDNFFQFVTAHGPFELTAIVLAAAAGMRLGFSMIDTRGLTRSAALREAAREAAPVVTTAVILLLGAALIEAFISPAPLPYWVKASVAVLTAGMLMFYFVVLGYPREPQRASRPATHRDS